MRHHREQLRIAHTILADMGAEAFADSPRTVEWHLTKMFGKLGIGSRKQLRAACPT